MEVEIDAEAKDKRLNRLVAITVVAFSVFTGVCNIKDGNIVQAMQQAKADAVDTWGEYQATRTKLHIAETARGEVGLIAAAAPAGAAGAAAKAELARLDGDIAKYRAEGPALQKKAQDFEARYDAINVHDDQFDASEAMIATAISMSAVAALAESFGLLAAGWVLGGFGIFMGLCGFLGWSFHPDVLSTVLG